MILPIRSTEGEQEEFRTFVPREKGLDPKWVQKLFERGSPTIWKGDALRYLGMPVGGLCCGQLYLGGGGELWHWDLCTQPTGWDMGNLSSGRHYANPLAPHSPIEHSIELWIGSRSWSLSRAGFPTVEFENRYPIGVVRYSAVDCPVEVELQAFSPFLPLQEEDSALPLTILEYTIRAKTSSPVEGQLRIQFENPVVKFSGRRDRFRLAADELETEGGQAVEFSAAPLPEPREPQPIPDFIFAPFEGEDFGEWKETGTAFGGRPMKVSELPERYRSANPVGKSFVNTHQSRQGEASVEADQHVGTLTSPEFTIRHKHINFRIGGGNHPGRTCLNLLVDGKVVRTATGRNTLTLRKETFDVSEFRGKPARLEIVDLEKGGWGHISIDQIVFSQKADLDTVPLERLPDFGTFAFGLWGGAKRGGGSTDPSRARLDRPFRAAKGRPAKITAAIAWHFPYYGAPEGSFAEIENIGNLHKQYAKRFDSARDVLAYYRLNERRLAGGTRQWADTWYGSTLPFWFLERCLIPVDCLATATAHWFDSGRFYGWEGVYCCPGTCQHVWNYAQAAARLFPALERSARTHADYGLSWQPDGTIWYRGESGRHIAHDGQAGTILRTYREHTMCPDDRFLRGIWGRVKTSIQRLIADDPNRDGLWEGEQYNTLDSSWFGKISWISSLYIAALRAGAEMARECGDADFASELERIVERGAARIVAETYNGEYFAMVRDPAHPRAPGHGPGCHIDQVFGDSFLHMVGLSPNLPRPEVRSALRSIWKYNYAPDAGGYLTAMQSVIRGGRRYAMEGEPGLLMTTFPRGGAREAKGEGNPDWMVGYFNECMNGFEYQAAAHMISEGMLTEGFAIVHSLHTRYASGRRNPYNEVECSDHYSRSMAAYGAYLAACGFAYHGPKGRIRFRPAVAGNRFRCAFTAAEGWGVFERNRAAERFDASLTLVFGHVRLTEIELDAPVEFVLQTASLGGRTVQARRTAQGVQFAQPITVQEGKALKLSLTRRRSKPE